MKKRVVVTDYTFPNLEFEQAAALLLGADFEAFQCKTEDEVVAAVKDADVVAVQFAPFTKRAAQSVKSGASIIRYGVGYDNIDVQAGKAAALKIGYVPDYCASEVADHTSAAILALLRKLLPLDASVRKGDWKAVAIARPMKAFEDTTIGFFGFGQIGVSVHARLKGFGFKFIVADPGLNPKVANALGVELCDGDALLKRADVISLHAPATPQTIGYFNAERLSKMQPTAMLVNSARGLLINEDDLAEALHNGVIAGAALDVFCVEPLGEDSKLRSAPNLILTPHAAWYSEAAIGKLQSLMAEDIARALKGEDPRKPVPFQ